MSTIKSLGERILSSISRSRDKCNAAGYCVRTNIGYRAQNCSWTTKDFEDVDAKYLSLIRKCSLNLPGFPKRLLTSLRKHGGLGITSISDAAHEQKRRVLLELSNKSGMDGITTDISKSTEQVLVK